MVVPRYMTESDVKVIALATVEVQEEKVGKPRHEENTANFKELFKWRDEVNGSIKAGLGLGKLIAFLLTILIALLSYLAARPRTTSAIIGTASTTTASYTTSDSR